MDSEKIWAACITIMVLSAVSCTAHENTVTAKMDPITLCVKRAYGTDARAECLRARSTVGAVGTDSR
jgi:hypothetical protein